MTSPMKEPTHKRDCPHKWEPSGRSVICHKCNSRRSARIRVTQRSAELLTDALNNQIRSVWAERQEAIVAGESSNPFNRDIAILRDILHQVQDVQEDFRW